MDTSEFVFRREINFRFNDSEKKGELRIGGIEKLKEGQWACHWSMSHVSPELSKIYGKDPLHALSECMNFLANLIRGSEQDGLKVWWEYEGDHCGVNFSFYNYSEQELKNL